MITNDHNEILDYSCMFCGGTLELKAFRHFSDSNSRCDVLCLQCGVSFIDVPVQYFMEKDLKNENRHDL